MRVGGATYLPKEVLVLLELELKKMMKQATLTT